MRRFIQTSKYPLDMERGGPLLINDLHIRRVNFRKNRSGRVIDYEIEPLSYIYGKVAAKGEALLGHHIAAIGDHIPRTFFLCDEASGVEDVAFERAETWANRQLWVGNCYPCSNRFYRSVKEGDILAKDLPPAPSQRK